MTSTETPSTYLEITSQPAVWAEAIDVVRSRAGLVSSRPLTSYSQLLFTGCGSTHFLSRAIAPLAQQFTGLISRAMPASEVLLHPASAFPRSAAPTLLVAVSRSGSTTETVHALRAFKRSQKGMSVAITVDEHSPLAKLADLVLAVPSGQEKSIAQTRSFAGMYLAALGLALQLGGRNDLFEHLSALPAAGSRLLAEAEPLVRPLAADRRYNRFFFLGNGMHFGLACEGNLKMKEMSLSTCEPFNFLEFRHGPKSLVDEHTLVVALLSESDRPHEEAVLEEMRGYGAGILTLGETGADVSFHSGLPEELQGVLYLPPMQLLAYHRALANGQNPDAPLHLSAVVELNWE